MARLSARRRAPAMPHRSLVFAVALLLVLASSLVATIRPVRAAAPFVDVDQNDPAKVAIDALFDRGVIKGYPTTPPTFGPGDLSLRAQMAALIARAMGWDLENNGNNFPDQCDPQGPYDPNKNCVDPDLWRNVGTLQARNVAKGYNDGTYDPRGNVLKQQVILFISRAKVAKGDWEKKPVNANLYPGSSSSDSDAQDIATYVYYAGAPPDAPTSLGPAWGDFASFATRGWFARALWQTYPEGKGTGVPGQTPGASPVPSPSPSNGPNWQRPAADASWLTVLNAYRALAGLPAVTEDASQSSDCAKHANYIVKTGTLAHTETAGPFYTDEGKLAAEQSNLGAGTGGFPGQRSTVEQFTGSVFHALGTFAPKLKTSGYASYSETPAPVSYNYGYCLNVLRGQTGAAGGTYPIRFPMADGVQPFLTAPIGGEAPDPLTACPGYTNPVGGVVLLQNSAAITQASTGTFKRVSDGATLDSCVYDGTNYTNPDGGLQGLGRSVLGGYNAVVLIPKQQLTAATAYRVSLTVNGTVYEWTFTTAATGQAIP